MGSRKSAHHHKKKERRKKASAEKEERIALQPGARKSLELVLKCDTSGCAEAIISAVASFAVPGVEIAIISSGIGSINKSDIFMAETGSRLIIGFSVGLMPHIDEIVAEHNVEVRLYDVIYKLLEGIESIAKSLVVQEPTEVIIGSAKVIALFKSSRHGIILGCEVTAGKLMLGQAFRVVSAMGPLYTGRIESLHIENDAVREAVKGQQVGLKIRGFNRVQLGDFVESFHATGQHYKPWRPQGRIFYP